MITAHEVQSQLKAIGANFKYWGMAEIAELEHILVPHELIQYCMNGRYEGGFALLCITDQRIILVDKKPLYLTLEDIRYDMVSEVDYSQQLLAATITVCTVNKKLTFTARKTQLLRQATAYIQNRVMEFRQQHMMATPQLFGEPPKAGEPTVNALVHRVTNPYTKVPLMMRRRVSRFYN
jgi:hypothetical protein